MVEDFKRGVYKNLNCLAPLEDHSLIGQAILTSNLQNGLNHIPSSSQQNMNYSDEQGMNHQIFFCRSYASFYHLFFHFLLLCVCLNLFVVGCGSYGKRMLLYI